MRNLTLFLLTALASLAAGAQCLTAFRDTRDTREDFFYIFDNGQLIQQEFQRIQSFQVGRKYIAYVSGNSAFKVYINGQTVKLQDFAPNEYFVTDYLLVYKNPGDLLYAFDGTRVQFLGRINPDFLQYAYGDSVVAFNDDLNSFILFFNGKITRYDNRLVTRFGGRENIIAFVASNYEYSVFYNGQVIEVESGSAPQSFQIHNNIVAYVDFVGDFKVFLNGEVITLETIAPVSYQVGENMVAYVNDIEKKFKVYYDGNDYELLPIPPNKYEVKDDMIVYSDSYNHFYVFHNGKTEKLAAYDPLSYMIDRGAVVFTDLDLRLEGYFDDKLQEVSAEKVDNYFLKNKAVLFSKVSSSMKVFCNGEITQLY